MDELVGTLYQKAKGYKEDEVSVEYVVDEDGSKRAVKEKVVTKYYPPDISALKAYLELNKENSDLLKMSDEELEAEKKRLIKKLSPTKRRKNEEQQKKQSK